MLINKRYFRIAEKKCTRARDTDAIYLFRNNLLVFQAEVSHQMALKERLKKQSR